jgi:uncharacterized protein YhaN
MKIRSIRLAAYGPFTDVTLDLPNTNPDFHIVFGPNEAGKSSALRALRHMLFGIPARTADNFLHAYTKLRVGARLVNSNGDKIDFFRRKGKAKTLRGHDDERVLDDDALAPFLGGISADVFEQMFAIGHEDLVRGGEEIISGKGSVGEALFAAGAGLIHLHNVQNELEQACGALFKATGSAPLINQKINAIKTARRSQKEALLLPKTWQGHDRELRDAQKRLEDVKKKLGACQQRQAKLERIRDALPFIARKKEIDADIVSYQGVPDLSDDFGEKRRDAEKELKLANRDLARFREAIENISKALNPLPVHKALLENGSAVESLQHDLGSFRKARKDKPGLEGRMRTLQKQATDLVDEIRADISGEAAKDLSLPPSTVGEIQTLGKEYERLTAKQESAGEQQRKLKSRLGILADQRKAMVAPVDVSSLENALQSAQAAGPIETQLSDMRIAVETLEGELNRFLKRQTLWKGSLEHIDQLPLPSKENIDRFESRFDTLQRSLEKQREIKASTGEEIAQTHADMQAIELSQDVPTETDLNDARGLRDRQWGLIRRKLEGQSPPGAEVHEIFPDVDNPEDLPDAFQKSMYHADHISDRLRREADQVTRKGLLEAKKKKLEKELVDGEAAFEKTLAMHHEYEAAWQKLWEPSGIAPQTPKEMGGWLSQIESLREKLVDLRAKKCQCNDLAKRLAALKSDVLAALEATGAYYDEKKPLSVLIKTAHAHMKNQQDLGSTIASADKDLAGLKVQLEESALTIDGLECELSNWKNSWKTRVGKIGIRSDAGPTAALAVIDSIREVRNKISEADILRKRIEGINRDSAEFSDRVDELVDTLAPDLKTESQDRAAEMLNGRLTNARKAESKQLSLKGQLESANKELEEAQRRNFECKAIIESLCKEAGCSSPEALGETEKRAQERKALTKELDDIVQQLRKLSAGATVDAFIDQASSLDADGIGPELKELDDETKGLEEERSALDQNIGALKAKLEQMDGRSEAAIQAEGAERLLASLESDVAKYARLKIASAILSKTVEQYREKHQGPLISRASEFFTRMTLGAFSRLRADYDEKGNPVLVGIRPENGAQVGVEGMSDGTADQLYLALRLAGLEQYLENNEPMPFVVDDILLRFDDERALATMAVLADFANKTQILFFTHHLHLVELTGRSKEPHLQCNLHRLAHRR